MVKRRVQIRLSSFVLSSFVLDSSFRNSYLRQALRTSHMFPYTGFLVEPPLDFLVRQPSRTNMLTMNPTQTGSSQRWIEVMIHVNIATKLDKIPR